MFNSVLCYCLCVMNSTAIFDDVNLEMQSSVLCVKYLDLDAELLNKDNAYNDLSKKYFKNNDLKAQLQTKDTTICKLKEHIKSMRENTNEENVKQEMDGIETINIELEHKQCDSLIAQLNSKSMENADLKGQIQEKVFVTTTLQNELMKLNGKNVLDNVATITNATTIAPGMFKLDLDPLAPRLANRDLTRGIPKLKFKKDYMCSACALAKSKKSSHQPTAKDTNQEKLYLLHIDLYGLMRVESINGKSTSW
ncbi:hypothetical protein Tco_0065080 [Tanacetum coccineum]